MSATGPIDNRAVAEFLSGPGSVRDGYLESIVVQELSYELVVELGFRTRSGLFYLLTLEDVFELDFALTRENAATQIAFVKCIWLGDDSFYLSLDPWLESEQVASDRDADSFRSRRARLVTIQRPPPRTATFR